MPRLIEPMRKCPKQKCKGFLRYQELGSNFCVTCTECDYIVSEEDFNRNEKEVIKIIEIIETKFFDENRLQEELEKLERSPWDFIGNTRYEIWEWLKIKVKIGILSKEKYNEIINAHGIIDYGFISRLRKKDFYKEYLIKEDKK